MGALCYWRATDCSPLAALASLDFPSLHGNVHRPREDGPGAPPPVPLNGWRTTWKVGELVQ